MGNQTLMIEKLKKVKILPVVKLDRVEDALPLAEALIKGGLPVAEVTFRTDAAYESIKAIRNKYPEMLVGAGTVTFLDQAKKAKEAGAQFIVSAGYNREVVHYAIDNNIPVFPGACTPTDLTALVNDGLEVAKFFPAEAFGGLKTIKALAGPFPYLKFIPTGGLNKDNMETYLESDKILAIGGSWMVKGSLINEGRFDEITRITAEAVQIASQYAAK